MPQLPKHCIAQLQSSVTAQQLELQLAQLTREMHTFIARPKADDNELDSV